MRHQSKEQHLAAEVKAVETTGGSARDKACEGATPNMDAPQHQQVEIETDTNKGVPDPDINQPKKVDVEKENKLNTNQQENSDGKEQDESKTDQENKNEKVDQENENKGCNNQRENDKNDQENGKMDDENAEKSTNDKQEDGKMDKEIKETDEKSQKDQESEKKPDDNHDEKNSDTIQQETGTEMEVKTMNTEKDKVDKEKKKNKDKEKDRDNKHKKDKKSKKDGKEKKHNDGQQEGDVRDGGQDIEMQSNVNENDVDVHMGSAEHDVGASESTEVAEEMGKSIKSLDACLGQFKTDLQEAGVPDVNMETTEQDTLEEALSKVSWTCFVWMGCFSFSP